MGTFSLTTLPHFLPRQASMGVDFYLKRLVLGNERNVSVQVWDVAGSALAGKMTDKVLSAGHEVRASRAQCERINECVRHAQAAHNPR